MDASTFPIPFWYHLILALVAAVFFLVQFIRIRRPYQLILSVAMLSSLLIYVGDVHNKAWFHTIGIFELVLLLGAVVLSLTRYIGEKKKPVPTAAKDAAASEKSDDGDAE